MGFARVVTDYATFAWLADVFVLERHRRQELGKWLLETVLGTRSCGGYARLLATKDAHGLSRASGHRR